MDIKQRQFIKKYVDSITYRWRFISCCLLLGMTLGVCVYFYLPKVYQSTALLTYEQQQINPAKMDPEQGKVRLQDSLATLKELVTSRNSLEKLIQQLALYEEVRNHLPIEDVIEMMRKKIDIKPLSKGDVFSVSFEGGEPQKVVRVANALAALFIEENLRYREERATETSKYTESELAMSKKVLDEKEQQMRDYKLKYFNEMPEQRESNLAQLRALMEQSQGVQTSIQEQERTKMQVVEQSRIQQQLASLSAQTASQNVASPSPETDAERLQRLRTHLNQVKEKYTDKHPEVRRTKQLIAQLEAKGVTANGPSVQGKGPTSNRAFWAANLESQRLQAQVQQIDLNIEQLRQTQAALPAQIAQYQKWIDAAPVREAEWNSLTRDYNELRRHYDQLVANNLQAQSAENLERNQKGSKFKIVDSARVSEKPIKPNFLKILLVAIAGGLGVSVGFILFLDFIDTSLKDVGELEEFTGLPVICAIPYIENESEAKKEQLFFYLSLGGVLAYAFGLVITMTVLWAKGLIIV